MNDYLNNLFVSILDLIRYSYNQMIEDNVKFHLTDDGRDSLNGMPLENSITNTLVHYIRVNKELYGLDLLSFEVEAAGEFGENFKTKGFLDIKVANITTLFSQRSVEDMYFGFECKRLDLTSSKINNYISEGVSRFTQKKYSANMNVAGMIGYCEVCSREIIERINDGLGSERLIKLEINSSCYKSLHQRDGSDEILLYHIFLDLSRSIVAN